MNADGGILNILGRGHKYEGRTFERHRVQRRLEEFTFARKCAGGRPLGPRVMLSFRSLASPGERTTEGVEHLQQAHEKVRADGKMIEVSKVRITEAGRGALTAEGR